jgi:hypothetical protein
LRISLDPLSFYQRVPKAESEKSYISRESIDFQLKPFPFIQQKSCVRVIRTKGGAGFRSLERLSLWKRPAGTMGQWAQCGGRTHGLCDSMRRISNIHPAPVSLTTQSLRLTTMCLEIGNEHYKL